MKTLFFLILLLTTDAVLADNSADLFKRQSIARLELLLTKLTAKLNSGIISNEVLHSQIILIRTHLNYLNDIKI